jgi:hypothetical protein
MSAQDNLSHGQFEQLDMFKTARELRGMKLADAHVWLLNRGLSSADESNVKRSRKNVMQRKRREAKKSGLLDSIREKGVQEPVEVGRRLYTGAQELVNGHHRVAAAMAVDPNMIIPVRH